MPTKLHWKVGDLTPMTALKPSSYKNGKSIGCGIFGFCLLSFPQNESKIYKLRQLSLSQFVCFLREVCFLFKFWMIKFTFMSKKSVTWWGTFIIQKLKSKHTSLKKYTNWDKLTCLSLYIFLLFWGNERRQKPSIPHSNQTT